MHTPNTRYIRCTFMILISFFWLLVAHTRHLRAQVSFQDSLALLELYNNTNGPEWTNNTGWSTAGTSAVSTWYGVTVTGGRVTEVALYNNNLSGQLPQALGDLTVLFTLDVGANRIEGSIPAILGNLTYLQNLYLDGNQFNGVVPTEIASLSDLQLLYLNDNQLSDLPDLSALPNLTHLYVNNNKFTFEDIEPNLGSASATFNYAPQDSVGLTIDTTLIAGESITLSVNVGGSYNQYQWYHNGNPISGATSSSYTLSSVTSGDGGKYSCTVTNSQATELTLWRRMITLTALDVSGPPVVAGIWPGQDGNCAIADYPVVKFDRPMDMTNIENSITLWGSGTGDIPFAVYPMDTLVVIAPLKPFYSLERVTVTVKGDAADLWGNTLDGDGSNTSDGTPADDYYWDFNITAAGDFNADRVIDFTDLMHFRQGWFSSPQDTYFELAPFSGSIPEIKVEPDGLVNFDDLMVLAKMWNWARYNLAKPVSLTSLAKSAVSIDPAVALQLVVNNESDSWTDTENRPLSLDLRLQEQRPLAGFSYTVHLDPEVFAYKSFEIADSLQGKDHNWLVLHHFDEGTGLLTLDMVKFGETGDDPRPVDQVGRIHTTVLKETAVTLNGLLDVRLANDSTQNYLGRVTYNINTASRAPDAFLLRPNFPNPFTDYTNIQYALPRKSDIRLMIFDLQGEKVRTIFEGTQSPGYYTEVWDGKSDRGIEVSSGMYFLILQTPEQTFRNKMILVK